MKGMEGTISLLGMAALAALLWPSGVSAQYNPLQAWPAQVFTQTGQTHALEVAPPLLLSQNGALREGDVVGALGSGDIDIYIINEHAYKRLFLNPVIFTFYGHLFGFQDVKNVSTDVRDAFGTSGLFRNCETNDERVFGLTVHGEDIASLHWVNTTAEQALIDDPDFFKKVFCINQKEFDWYPVGQSFSSVSEIPNYSRVQLVQGEAPDGGFLGRVTGDTLSGGSSGGGGGGGGGGSIEDTWEPSADCPGGGGRVKGLPTCFMAADLVGSAWNLVDDATGDILNSSVCSAVVCGPNGVFRVQLSYPSGATYIQSPFDANYGGKYYTNGVWETDGGGIVQPGEESFE